MTADLPVGVTNRQRGEQMICPILFPKLGFWHAIWVRAPARCRIACTNPQRSGEG